MNNRPVLTAACFLLFAMAFVSANVKPATLYCATSMIVEPESLHRLLDDVRQVLHEATRPYKAD
ncbi:MAG: hypothetical protein V4484_12595 [Pseudomonadota bacterium]